MLVWVIQMSIISFTLIFLIHHLFDFFKSTLTVPKLKDLVNTSSKKYENMYNIINNNLDKDNNVNNETSYTLIDLLPNNETDNMKDELKNFLKSQLN
jgi:hypothetical protein